MMFLNPTGLLGLLGLPLLVFLYLKKQKYEERRISSTYLWELSLRFYNKYLPVQRMKKALLFMIQSSMIILCSLMIAQPRISLNETAREYIAILDASASMLIEQEDGKTRFDHAKARLLEDLGTLGRGSYVIVLQTGRDEALASRTSSIQEARRAVQRAVCTYTAHTPESAFQKATEFTALFPAAETVFYTDKQYPEARTVRVVDIGSHREWNAAITGLNAVKRQDGMEFVTDVVSYGKDAQLTLALYIDQRLAGARMAHCPEGETISLVWNAEGLTAYSEARAVLNVTDALAEDNAYWHFPPVSDTIRVLLVSERPFFLSNALSAFPAARVLTVSAPETDRMAGFDLYVFDGMLPEKLPDDGAVWLFNPPRAPEGMDFVLGDMLTGGPLALVHDITDPELAALTDNMSLQGAAAARFREIISTGSYAALILCGRMPLVLAGQNDQGAKQLVAAFDLRDSNLPLLTDFVYLIGNALRFSVPEMLDAPEYQAGQALMARVWPYTEDIHLLLPDNQIIQLKDEQGFAALSPSLPGAYTLLQRRGGLDAKSHRFFAAFPVEESNPTRQADNSPLLVSAAGIVSVAETGETRDNLMNPSAALAAAFLLLLLLEMMVFHNEQA